MIKKVLYVGVFVLTINAMWKCIIDMNKIDNHFQNSFEKGTPTANKYGEPPIN